MLKAFRDLFILMTIILVALAITAFFKTQAVLDIQLHDSYIVLAWPTIVVCIGGPLIVLVYFFRGLVKKFRNAGTNACLIIGLLFNSYAILMLIRMWDYQFGKGWIILILSGIAILVLIVRTINVWRYETSQS